MKHGTMKTFLRQGLAIRRQNDKECNVYQFNKDKGQHIPRLKLLMEEKSLYPTACLESSMKYLFLRVDDGSMAMKSLAKKIESEINESAIFIHRLAHCQELIFKDATKHCPALEDSQALCEYLYIIVGISSKRVALFAKIQDEIDNDDVLCLQNVSRTRWTTRGTEGNVITLKHAELLATLKIISEEKKY